MNNKIIKRSNVINYGKQTIAEDDIQSVLEILRENKYLTTGPQVKIFEEELCHISNMKYCVAVSNGTAALHCAIHSLNIKEGDDVLVTTMSFVASANCIIYQNANPIFVDINPNTMNIDTADLKKKITKKSKAVIVVDFAGQLCEYNEIKQICDENNLIIIEDASHSVGIVNWNNKGYHGDLITYSFHPVKNITTGEGGAILTNNKQYYKKMRMFRNHGIDNDYGNRHLHYYNMIDLGYNYRLTDLQCALGINQLKKLDQWIDIRKKIADKYNEEFRQLNKYIEPLTIINNCAFHIYIIKLNLDNIICDRDQIYKYLRELNIGVNVHYKPIHLQPFYLENYNTFEGLCPNAEQIYTKIITLPIYPTLSDEEVTYIIKAIKKIIDDNKK